jgi:hypothetical protein
VRAVAGDHRDARIAGVGKCAAGRGGLRGIASIVVTFWAPNLWASSAAL